MVNVHNDAVQDLQEIRTKNPLAFGRIVALIQELTTDPRLVDKLLDHNFGADGRGTVSVMKWIKAWRANVPVRRLKFWDLEKTGLKYRLLYIYNWPDKSYNIMAIVARDEFDYDDPAHPIRLRVFNQCRKEFPNA